MRVTNPVTAPGNKDKQLELVLKASVALAL